MTKIWIQGAQATYLVVNIILLHTLLLDAKMLKETEPEKKA